MLVLRSLLSTAVGLARPFLVHGKYKICGLCQVVPDWARLGGSCGDASVLFDAGDDIEFELLVLFVELATNNSAEDSRVIISQDI